MAGGKPVEKIQDATLAMFNVDKNRTTTFIHDQVTLSRQKREKEDQRRNGLTIAEYDKLKKEQGKQAFLKSVQEEESKSLKQASSLSHYHQLLQEFYSLFPSTIINFNKETLDEIPSKIKGLTLWNQDETEIEIKKARLNKGCIQVTLSVTYQKPIFVKADDFDITKNVIESSRTITEEQKIKCQYGTLITFRQSTTAQFNELIKKYSIKNTVSSQLSNEDSWKF